MQKIIFQLAAKYSHLLGLSLLLSLTAAYLDYRTVRFFISPVNKLGGAFPVISWLLLSSSLKLAIVVLNNYTIKIFSTREAEKVAKTFVANAKIHDNAQFSSINTMVIYKIQDIAASMLTILEGIKGITIFLAIASILAIKYQTGTRSAALSFAVLLGILASVTFVYNKLIKWGRLANYELNRASEKTLLLQRNQVQLFTNDERYLKESLFLSISRLRASQFKIQTVSQNFRYILELSFLTAAGALIWQGYGTIHTLIAAIVILQRFMPNIQVFFHAVFVVGVTRASVEEFAELVKPRKAVEELTTVDMKNSKDFTYISMNSNDQISFPQNMTFVFGNSYYLRGDSGSGKTTYLLGLLGVASGLGELHIRESVYRNYLMKNVYFMNNDCRIYGDGWSDYFINAEEESVKAIMRELRLSDKTVEKIFDKDVIFSKAAETLSTGEYQRVKLAAAILSPMALKILDEPFSALDRETAERCRELVHGRNSSCVYIIVDHGR